MKIGISGMILSIIYTYTRCGGFCIMKAKVTMKNYESPRGSRLNILPVRLSSMPPLIVQVKPKVLLLSLATEN